MIAAVPSPEEGTEDAEGLALYLRLRAEARARVRAMLLREEAERS